MSPILGYWNLRGLCNPIKYILAYCGVDIDEVQYAELEGPNGVDDSQWTSVKYKLGLIMPNIPYYIDGNLRITETNAILSYLARKYKLNGKTEQDNVILDIMSNALTEMRYRRLTITYTGVNMIETKPMFAAYLEAKLNSLFEYMDNKKWILGDTISYIDFVLYEELAIDNLFVPEVISKFPRARKYMQEFEKLEPIQKYMKSSKYIEKPVNGKNAHWGNTA